MSRTTLVFLIAVSIACVSFAQYSPEGALPQTTIGTTIQGVINGVRNVFFVFLLVFIVFGAALYTLGQVMGGETRARVTLYLNNVLMGIIIVAVLYVATPPFLDVLLPPDLKVSTSGNAGELYAISIAFLSVLLSGMALVLARVLDHRQLEQAAKTELVFAASTVFIVVALVLLINLLEPVMVKIVTNMYVRIYAPSFVGDPNFHLGGPDATLSDMAKYYLAAPQACMQTAMQILEIMAIPVEAMASIFLEIFMSEHASGFAFKFLSERINNLAKILTFYQWGSYLLYHMFNFIKYYWHLFLVSGIALRAFPPTRGAGAYLIALSVGLYIIFPFSYIALSTVLSNFTFNKDLYAGTPTAAGAVGAPAGGASFACKLPSIAALEEITYCGASDPRSIKELQQSFNAHQGEIISILDYFSGNLLKSISLAVCFLPLVALTLTLSFVLSTTSLFGGQIPEIGRGLIKLI